MSNSKIQTETLVEATSENMLSESQIQAITKEVKQADNPIISGTGVFDQRPVDSKLKDNIIERSLQIETANSNKEKNVQGAANTSGPADDSLLERVSTLVKKSLRICEDSTTELKTQSTFDSRPVNDDLTYAVQAFAQQAEIAQQRKADIASGKPVGEYDTTTTLEDKVESLKEAARQKESQKQVELEPVDLGVIEVVPVQAEGEDPNTEFVDIVTETTETVKTVELTAEEGLTITKSEVKTTSVEEVPLPVDQPLPGSVKVLEDQQEEMRKEVNSKAKELINNAINTLFSMFNRLSR